MSIKIDGRKQLGDFYFHRFIIIIFSIFWLIFDKFVCTFIDSLVKITTNIPFKR